MDQLGREHRWSYLHCINVYGESDGWMRRNIKKGDAKRVSLPENPCSVFGKPLKAPVEVKTKVLGEVPVEPMVLLVLLPGDIPMRSCWMAREESSRP